MSWLEPGQSLMNGLPASRGQQLTLAIGINSFSKTSLVCCNMRFVVKGMLSTSITTCCNSAGKINNLQVRYQQLQATTQLVKQRKSSVHAC